MSSNQNTNIKKSFNKEETYKKWKSLVNMTKSELEKFYNSEEGKEAGLSSSEAKSLKIHSGRESARWIMKMKDTPHDKWTAPMWEWAKRQISFISRMRGNNGGLYDDKGNKTRKHTSLLIWGHNPEKYKRGGSISKTPAPKSDRVYGSDVNAKNSSKDLASSKEIKFDASTLSAIKSKVQEHNKKYPSRKITIEAAKAVVRRGMGAYSVSHRPTISGGEQNSRVAWGLARLNAFLYKLIHGKSKSGKYAQDNDLIDELNISHEKYEGGGSIDDFTEGDYTNVGIVEDVTKTQVKANGEWYHKSIVRKVDNKKTPKDSNANYYNDLIVPKRIDPNKVISAFANPIDYNKVEKYASVFKEEMLSHNFPKITGYPYEIEKEDVGSYFLSGKEITKKEVGEKVWKVWEGHHRVLAAIEAELPYLETELEYSAITEKMKSGGEVTLLAPNGKKSNLTAEQWHLVRQQNFIQWFGDFEKYGYYDKMLNSDCIFNIEKKYPYDYFSMSHKERNRHYTDIIKESKAKANNATTKDGFNISITNSGLLHGIRHSMMEVVLNSCFFLKEIIENSILFDMEKNGDVEDTSTVGFYCFLSIVKYLETDYLFRVTAALRADKRIELYDYNVVEIKMHLANTLNPQQGNTNHQVQHKDRKFFELTNTLEKNISKVIDSNGEPMICYRGVINNKKDIEAKNPYYIKGMWFTSASSDENNYEEGNAESVARGFSDIGEIESVFLNIKNPKIYDDYEDILDEIDKKGGVDNFYKSFIKRDGLKLEGSMTDGDVFRDDWVVFNVNQIKLADGSNTAFDINNPDIHYGKGGVISNEAKDKFKYMIENWQEPFFRNEMIAKDIRFCESLVNKGVISKGSSNYKNKQYMSDDAIDNVELAYNLVNEMGLQETEGGERIVRAYNFQIKNKSTEPIQFGIGGEMPKLLKVKSFKTNEGSFDIYDTDKGGARGRGDMFTILKDKNGWIVRNAFVPDNLQKKGIATYFYKKMNDESLKATGKPLRSTQQRTLNNGEVVHELTQNAIKLWDSLVRDGFAEKLGEKNYRFLKEGSFKDGGFINETMDLWHGGNLEEYNDVIAQKNGRYEYGAGLYLTDHKETAIKYAKGSRKLYLITIEKGVDITDAFLDIEVVNSFINKYVIGNKKKEVKERIGKYVKDGKVKAFLLNNIILNEKAISSTNTNKLRSFYVENGIDYEVVDNAFGWGETMVVLYNMDKIVKKEKQDKKYEEGGSIDNDVKDVAYYGSPIYKEKGELMPATSGELGAGLYFTRNYKLAENYAQPRGEVSNMVLAKSKSGVSELDLSGIEIKSITKDDYINKRSEFYDAEQKLNNGDWSLDIAHSAEIKLIDYYELSGYDGLEVESEEQGVVFPNSIKNIKHKLVEADKEMRQGGTVDYNFSDDLNNFIDVDTLERNGFGDILYNSHPDKKRIKDLNDYFRRNSNKLFVLYHGTDRDIPILEEGLKKTSEKRRRSYQSESGYVYLTPFKDTARTFGEMGNPYGAKVYEVKIPVRFLLPDKDQLGNKREVSDFTIGDTLSESVILGGSVRVKGNIPVYMIEETNYENGGVLDIDNSKKFTLLHNNDKAPYLGSLYGQDVEPTGFFAIIKHNNDLDSLPNYDTYVFYSKKQLYIPIESDNYISWKNELSKKYKAKKSALTKKLLAEGYDILITVYDNGDTGEVIVLDDKYLVKLPKSENMKSGGEVTLLAPNGKPSNLTPEQWKLVRTPEFKAWFGDWEKLVKAKINDSGIDDVTIEYLSRDVSKVVDSNGEPLPVYHGTENEFYIFEKTKIGSNTDEGIFGRGFYFSKKNIVAQHYGKYIKEVFLNIKNPLNIGEFKDKKEMSEKLNIDEDILTEGGTGFRPYLPYIGIFTATLKDNGYDGVTTKYGEIVVFYHNQIKLADGTNTTFDSSNPDIRYSEGGIVSWEDYKKTQFNEDENRYLPSDYFEPFEIKDNLKNNHSVLLDTKNGIEYRLEDGSENSIGAFDGEYLIGYADNGAVQVSEKYQRRGIGLNLITLIKEINPQHRFGNMTPQGFNLMGSYYDKKFAISDRIKEQGGITEKDLYCCSCGEMFKLSENDNYICPNCNYDNETEYIMSALKPTKTLEEISSIHNVPVSDLQKQLDKGIEEEKSEHTNNSIDIARIIALHHIEKDPYHYINKEDISDVEDGNIIHDAPENFMEEPFVLWTVKGGDPTGWFFHDLESAALFAEQQGILTNEEPFYIRDRFTGKTLLDKEQIQRIIDKKFDFSSIDYEYGGVMEGIVKIKEYIKQQIQFCEDLLHSDRTKLYKTVTCMTNIENAKHNEENAEEGHEKNIWFEVGKLWKDNLAKVKNGFCKHGKVEFASGGVADCGCGNNMKFANGGLAYGNSHHRGGMPIVVKSTGQNIEIEGGEGVVNKTVMQSSKTLEINGKRMTPCQAVSKINQMDGNGVKFQCDDVKEILAQDGNFA